MTINYNESFRNARILSRVGSSMRIALEDGDDAVELRLCDGVWVSEKLIPVSFEFLEGPEIPLVYGESGGRADEWRPAVECSAEETSPAGRAG